MYLWPSGGLGRGHFAGCLETAELLGYRGRQPRLSTLSLCRFRSLFFLRLPARPGREVRRQTEELICTSCYWKMVHEIRAYYESNGCECVRQELLWTSGKPTRTSSRSLGPPKDSPGPALRPSENRTSFPSLRAIAVYCRLSTSQCDLVNSTIEERLSQFYVRPGTTRDNHFLLNRVRFLRLTQPPHCSSARDSTGFGILESGYGDGLRREPRPFPCRTFRVGVGVGAAFRP